MSIAAIHPIQGRSKTIHNPGELTYNPIFKEVRTVHLILSSSSDKFFRCEEGEAQN